MTPMRTPLIHQHDARRAPQHAPLHASRHHRRSAGFTLEELLIVIGIIGLLVGIGIFAAGGFRTEGERQQTVGILQQAHSVATEYQATAGEKINVYGNTPIDWSTITTRVNDPTHSDYDPDDDPDTPPLPGTMSNEYIDIERFIWRAQQVPEAKRILDNFRFGTQTADGVEEGGRLRDTDGDGFVELVDAWGTPIKYFRQNVSTETPYDNRFPAHRQPFFASAGASRDWDNTEDNVHSFELD